MAASHPPPQVHDPMVGYMNAVNSRVKRKKLHILTRSASAPEIMDAVVATKTIWKNQSDMTEYPLSTTAASADSSPLRRANSSPEGP